MNKQNTFVIACVALTSLSSSRAPEAEGLPFAGAANTTVKMDFFAKPLPEIALPNDIATRYDGSAATGRRINASMVASTGFEQLTRKRLDLLDGWGVLQSITVLPLTIAPRTWAYPCRGVSTRPFMKLIALRMSSPARLSK